MIWDRWIYCFAGFLLLITLAMTGCEDTIEKTTQIFSSSRQTPKYAQSQPIAHQVEAGEMLGFYHSLAVAGGTPALAYQSPAGLRYAHSDEGLPGDAENWTAHTVDPDPRSGIAVELVVCGDQPVLIYRSGDRESLEQRFAAAQTAEPQSAEDWATGVFPESLGLRDPDCAAVIDGRPAFVTTNTATGQLIYVYASKAAPVSSADWRAIPVTEDSVLKQSPRLVEIDGVPVVAYITAGRDQAVIATADSARPTYPGNWTAEVAAETPELEAGCFDCTVADGAPVLVHCLVKASTMAYTSSSVDTEGNVTWRTDKVADWRDHSYGIDLIFDGTTPVAANSLKSKVVLVNPAATGLNDTENWEMRKASPNGRLDARNCQAVHVDNRTVVSYFKFAPDEGLYVSVVY